MTTEVRGLARGAKEGREGKPRSSPRRRRSTRRRRGRSSGRAETPASSHYIAVGLRHLKTGTFLKSPGTSTRMWLINPREGAFELLRTSLFLSPISITTEVDGGGHRGDPEGERHLREDDFRTFADGPLLPAEDRLRGDVAHAGDGGAGLRLRADGKDEHHRTGKADLEEHVTSRRRRPERRERPEQEVRLDDPAADEQGDRRPDQLPEPLLHERQEERALERHLVLPEHGVQDHDVENHPSQPRDRGKQVGGRQRHLKNFHR